MSDDDWTDDEELQFLRAFARWLESQKVDSRNAMPALTKYIASEMALAANDIDDMRCGIYSFFSSFSAVAEDVFEVRLEKGDV